MEKEVPTTVAQVIAESLALRESSGALYEQMIVGLDQRYRLINAIDQISAQSRKTL
jgi:hypothetical protein